MMSAVAPKGAAESCQVEAETGAAIDAIVSVIESGEPISSEIAVAAFCLYGDAIRLGIDAPRALRLWAAGASASLVDKILGAAMAHVSRRIPLPGTADADLDPTMTTTLIARDHAESILLAVRRVWLPRALSDFAKYSALVSRIAEFDCETRGLLSRAQVLTLLESRAAFGANWSI